MGHRTNRRRFLQAGAAAGVGFWVAGGAQAKESKAANERIQFGSIGVAGKGSSDSQDAARAGDMVAICDIDEKNLQSAKRRKGFEKAKEFFDFREMLEKMGDKLDAVTVSTPDHTHAPAAVMAMKQGIHCFCQKPLTHAIYEARVMGEIAREKKLATQMGNQGTAMAGLRKAAATLKTGALGRVKEVHVWTNRPVWPQGQDRPEPADPPPNVKWDLFIAAAPYRPYAPGYHPFKWRGWWDFGTGALGDMACHTMNMPFMGLDLRDPLSVEAETSGHNKDSYPKWSVIRYEFGKQGDREPLTMFWYDGGKRPDRELFPGGQFPRDEKGRIIASGCLIIGEKGNLFSPRDYGADYELQGIEQPEVEFTRSPGHFNEFVRAIKTGEPAMSNFPDYASPLTETVLLGNLAVWSGTKVEWDAKNLKAKGMPELDKIIKPEYREGYSL